MNRKTLIVRAWSHYEKHSENIYRNPSRNVGGLAFTRNGRRQYNMKPPFLQNAATNLKTLKIRVCPWSHDEKHSVKILSKSVKKLGWELHSRSDGEDDANICR